MIINQLIQILLQIDFFIFYNTKFDNKGVLIHCDRILFYFLDHIKFSNIRKFGNIF